MVKIEELLTSGENIIKKQSRVMYEYAGGPTGDLYLTNMRLIFLPKKRWALLSPGALLGKDIIISLQGIRLVSKGSFGSVKVQSDKDHLFFVSLWNTSSWVDTIQQTLSSTQRQGPPRQQPRFQQSYNPPPPPPPPTNVQHCGNCGRPLEFIHKYNRWYCRTCQKYA
ncbi:hypothetical protein KAI60_03210 [Candidatus Bathyarchaeota archaeon]|nr:hypothetical protein [Candidatus Bathyarchaeota archaeon]